MGIEHMHIYIKEFEVNISHVVEIQKSFSDVKQLFFSVLLVWKVLIRERLKMLWLCALSQDATHARAHRHTRTHSPCRYLAVVHVRCDDNACLPFVALEERRVGGWGRKS